MASTIGDGAPTMTAVTQTTEPAMTDMARLPSNVYEIVSVTSFSTRSTRLASPGGSIASAPRLRSGQPTRRNSVRKTSVTTLSTDPTSAPVIPSSAPAACGIF